MTTSKRERTARPACPASNVVSIRDFLLRRSAQLAGTCAHTQRVRAFAATLPPGTSPDEADAMIRTHLDNLAG